MRKKFQSSKVNIPAFKEITRLSEAEHFIEKNGLPVIIKAIDNSASRGTTIMRTLDLKLIESALEYAKVSSSTNTALIEDLLEGSEQSVETIVYGGEHYRCGVVDRHFMKSAYSIETGHTNPTNLSLDIQEELYEQTRLGADALGIEFGAAKSDIMLTEKGPYILELTARLSGGFHCQYTTPLALGIDVIKATMEIHLGKEFNEKLIAPKFNRYATCLAKFPTPGVVASIEGLEDARKSQGLEEIFILTKVGSEIEDYRTCADRVAYLITVGETYKQSLELNHKAQEKLIINTNKVDRHANSKLGEGAMVDFYKTD